MLNILNLDTLFLWINQIKNMSVHKLLYTQILLRIQIEKNISPCNYNTKLNNICEKLEFYKHNY